MSEDKTLAKNIIEDAKLQRALKDDYRRLFLGSDIGKRVLTDLLQYCGVLRPIVQIGNSDETIYNAGKQSVGLLLMDILDTRGYEAIMELEKAGAELTKIGEVE